MNTDTLHHRSYHGLFQLVAEVYRLVFPDLSPQICWESCCSDREYPLGLRLRPLIGRRQS